MIHARESVCIRAAGSIISVASALKRGKSSSLKSSRPRLDEEYPRKERRVINIKGLFSLLAGLFLLLCVAAMVSVESQKRPSTKEDRLSGTVHMIDKDASTIILRKGAVQRKVVYNAETKFTIQNKPGSIDDVIVGRRAICLGTFNDKAQLVADRVDVRTK
jgi:hypothetical protein